MQAGAGAACQDDLPVSRVLFQMRQLINSSVGVYCPMR